MTTSHSPEPNQNAMAREWTGLKKTGGKFLKTFAFEMFLEQFYPELIKQMRMALGFMTPEEIEGMINSNQYPELPLETYQQLQGYEEYLQNITVQRMWAAMAEGCPDLAMAVDSMGDKGYRWFWRFRNRILKGIRAGHPLSNQTEGEVPMVGVTCDVCKQTVILRKDEALRLTKCPRCGAPAAAASGGGPEPVQEEAPAPEPEAEEEPTHGEDMLY